MTNVTLREGDILSLNAPVAASVAGNHAIIFHCMHYSGFQVLGTPLGALGNRELLCWDLPDRGKHARHTAPASRPLSCISHNRYADPALRV
ncbi:hypothetical protein PMI05_01582 [Brevibacillus sp. BC25]|nr:hypothetical protein PMI05_01582 [Brevibacillus sp. BC25]